MSGLLIENVRLLCPAQGLDETGRLGLLEGRICEPDALPEGSRRIDGANLCLAPGLIDVCVRCGEPGSETDETVASAGRAALAGGVTTILLHSSDRARITGPETVRFLLGRAEEAAVHVLVAGAALRNQDSGAMSEMGLMAQAGAALFSDERRGMVRPGEMKRAMRHAGGLGHSLMVEADLPELSGGGVMAAGPLAMRMGLPGIGADAEAAGLAVALILAEATGATLALSGVSLADSVREVSVAKRQGLPVLSVVPATHLRFNTADIGAYRTFFKLRPPLRPEADRAALVGELKAGRIDILSSFHDPRPPEAKRLPFAEAAFGAVGLETLLPTLLGLVEEGACSMLEALRPVTAAPASFLGLDSGTLAPGAPADLVLFDPAKPWVCNPERLSSLSRNTPFEDARMVGRVEGVLVGGAGGTGLLA